MKKSLSILALACVVFAWSCQTSKQTEDVSAVDTTTIAKPSVTLTKKWETDSVLTTAESVIYDKTNDVLYVSNINGDPTGKDGNGFISKVALDGKITELNWVKGMDAPKGLGIFNGVLFVTDIDRIHEIEIASGKISKTHKAEGAQFLNDITVDSSGKVYASDSNTGIIYVIDGGKLSKFMENVESANGLLAENNQLIVLGFQSQKLSIVDLTTKQVTVKVDSIENGDGLEAVGDGTYLASSWNGMVTHVSADGTKTVLLDTRADEVNAADIEFIAEKNLLLVPAFFKNKVVAYELSR
jgi:sugar lactone lactonase YvrE